MRRPLIGSAILLAGALSALPMSRVFAGPTEADKSAHTSAPGADKSPHTSAPGADKSPHTSAPGADKSAHTSAPGADKNAHVSAPGAAKSELGKPAPAFKLHDTDGKEVSLKSLKGKVVVLEWFNPDCPFAKFAHTKGPLAELAKRVSNDKLVWLTINSSAASKQGNGLERNQKAKEEYGITNTVLLDEDGKVGHAYGAEKTPHIFVIDAKGVLRYRGGLDNAPMGTVDNERPHLPETAVGSLEPYVQDALDDLAAKRPVRLAETPAYGCSVKYAD